MLPVSLARICYQRCWGKDIGCASLVVGPNGNRLASRRFKVTSDRLTLYVRLPGDAARSFTWQASPIPLLRSQAERDEAERINVDGARNVLVAARGTGAERVLLASSAHVYAGQEGNNLGEKSATAGDSFYARTKLMVEQAGLEAASAGGPAIVIVRPCLTYGPGVRFNLESLMRAIRGHYYFHIRGSNPMRSFLSVDNAAAAITHLLQVGENGRIYNLADQTPIPLVEFVNSLADLMQTSRPRNLPLLAIRSAIAGTAPLKWMGLRSPINSESLRKLTVSFTLDVKQLDISGFRWSDDSLAARRRMVEAYCRPRGAKLINAPSC